MSVAFADYDGDGWPDVFVTNDNMPNFLFHNLGNGTFEEVALLAGAALRDDGKPVASMGAEFKDYDNDGRPDIFVTALAGETFPLFRNAGKGNFIDATHEIPPGSADLAAQRLGTRPLRFQQRRLEGSVHRQLARERPRGEVRAGRLPREANSVFANAGGMFQDVSTEAGLTPGEGAPRRRLRGFRWRRPHRRGGVLAGRAGGTLGEREPGRAHWMILRLRGTKAIATASAPGSASGINTRR